MPVAIPLAADETLFIEYVAWHARRGRVRMTVKNFQPYLSAINKLYKAVKSKIFAGGEKVCDATKAAGRRQRLADAGARSLPRTYLPASVALSILERAEDMVSCLTGEFDDPGALLELLRHCSPPSTASCGSTGPTRRSARGGRTSAWVRRSCSSSSATSRPTWKAC